MACRAYDDMGGCNRREIEAGKGNLQPISSLQTFAEKFNAQLTVSEQSEHPFMDSDDYKIVEKWLTDNI